MVKILEILRSDFILTLVGGMVIGFMALSFIEPVGAGHAHIYADSRSISVEQPINY